MVKQIYGLYAAGDQLAANDATCYFRNYTGGAMVRTTNSVTRGTAVTVSANGGAVTRYVGRYWTHVTAGTQSGWLRTADLIWLGAPVQVPVNQRQAP